MNTIVKCIRLCVITLVLYSACSYGMQPQTPFTGATYQQTPMMPMQQAHQPGGYGIHQPLAYKTVTQPQLGTQPQALPASHATIVGNTTPVAPHVLSTIFQNIDLLWNLYSTAPRTTTYQFSDINQWNQMYQYAQIINYWAQQANNPDLKNVTKNLENLFAFQNPNLLAAKFFVDQLNNILTVANNIIKAHSNLYNQQYQTNPHNLIAEHRALTAPGKPAPSLFAAQQAVTGTIYDWTRPVTGTVGGALSTGWEYAKWAGRGLGGGLGSIRKYALPTQEEVDMAIKELPKIQEEIGALRLLKEQLGVNFPAEQQARLTELEATDYYYRGIIRGWKYVIGGAAVLGGAYLGSKYLR